MIGGATTRSASRGLQRTTETASAPGHFGLAVNDDSHSRRVGLEAGRGFIDFERQL